MGRNGRAKGIKEGKKGEEGESKVPSGVKRSSFDI